MNKQVLTQKGLEELKRELEELKTVKLPQAIARVAAAREQGDLSENSEYAAARDELSFLEGRIVELEEVLHNAQVISVSTTKNTIVIGSTVHMTINGRSETFTIVGEWEANPKLKKISYSSPLGKALMGKKAGDSVEVNAPAGKLTYKIESLG